MKIVSHLSRTCVPLTMKISSPCSHCSPVDAFQFLGAVTFSDLLDVFSARWAREHALSIDSPLLEASARTHSFSTRKWTSSMGIEASTQISDFGMNRNTCPLPDTKSLSRVFLTRVPSTR